MVFEGYDPDFVEAGLAFVSSKLDDYDVKTAASALAAFARENPDCKPQVMLADITAMLREVMEADGFIDEREEMAIERIEKTFSDEMRFSLSRTLAPVGRSAGGVAGATVSAAGFVASTAGMTAGRMGRGASRTVSGALSKGVGVFKGASGHGEVNAPAVEAEDPKSH